MKRYRSFLPLLVLFYSFFVVTAQTRKLDSMKLLVKTLPEDTNKVKLLSKISDKLGRLGIYDSAEYYVNLSIRLAEKLRYKNGLAWALYNKGSINWHTSKFAEARKYFSETLKLSKNPEDKNAEASAYTSIGNTYKDEGNYPEALRNYLVGLKIWEKVGYKEGVAVSHNNIGLVYLWQGNYKEALEHHFASKKIEEESGNKSGLGGAYGNIGNVYWNQGNYKEALKFHQMSKKIDEEIGNVKGVAYSWVNIGCIYHDMGDHVEALKNFFAGLAMTEELNDESAAATAYSNIGSSYGKMKNYSEAEKYCRKAIALAERIEDLETAKDAYLNLSEVCASQGKEKEALQSYRSYIALRDSLINEENTTKMIRLQVNYEFDKKQDSLKAIQDIKDVIAAEQNKIKDLRLSRSRYIAYGLSGLVILVLIIAVLFVRQNKLRAAQRSMQLEQKLLRSQMNPHFIFNSLIAIESFIYTNEPKSAGRYLSDFAKLMRMILENSREEFVLMEKEIKTLELYLNLQKLRFDEKFSYSIELINDPDIENILIPPMLAQPFIENAIEHGLKNKERDGRITIRFELKEEEILFSVEDNGMGMQQSSLINQQRENHKSMATTITNERLHILNKGRRKKITLQFEDLMDSGKGVSGTRVSFSIPYKEA